MNFRKVNNIDGFFRKISEEFDEEEYLENQKTYEDSPNYQYSVNRLKRQWGLSDEEINNYIRPLTLPNGELCYLQRLVNKPKIQTIHLNENKIIGWFVWDDYNTAKYTKHNVLIIWGESINAIEVNPEYQNMGIGEAMIQFAMDITNKTSIHIIGPQTEEGKRLFDKFNKI